MAEVAQDEIKVDITLGHVGRHCILHALTVIEAAISQVGSNLLDDYVKDLTQLVKVASPNTEKKKKNKEFKPLLPPPIITSFEANKFYESVLSAVEFTKLLEEKLKSTALESSINLDVDKVQEICWKYYSKEKRKALDYPDWLSPTCTYRLFLIFNQLLSVEMTTTITGQKLCFFLEKVATSCGFLGPVVSQVVKKDRHFGVTFPEFLEEVTNCFDYLKLETCLTCEMILDFTDELVNGVLKKGYLTKEGHLRRNWKRRYFILQENIMRYYASRETMHLKGEMVLNSTTKVFPLPDKKGKPLYRFVVTCGASGKVFKISATDQREKSEWLCAIKEAIAIGRLKSTSSGRGDDDNIDCNDDMCEMAAHYKVKYGLEGLEKSLTIASKRFSKVLNYHEDSGSPSTERSITGSLPNLLADSLDEPKNDNDNDDDDDDDDNGDDISYMVMHPAKKGIQHTLSLDRIDLKAEPSHKPLTYSTSSGVSFNYSDSISSDMLSNSIRTPNGYLHSPGSFSERTFSGNKKGHLAIYQNTDDVFNEEEEDDDDDNEGDEYYVFSPSKVTAGRNTSSVDIDDDNNDDDNPEHDYLKLVPAVHSNQK